MAKRGGFPGGMPGNINNLMKQAQKLQQQAVEQQKALEEKEYTSTAGGGAVEVVMTGSHEIKSITLSNEVVDPDDIEMLQDLIIAAVNEAYKKVDEDAQSAMSRLTGGLGNMGGLGGFGL